MNDFEKHLRKHKDDYQLQEPHPRVWKGIKSAQAKQKKPVLRRLRTWQIAAAVVAIIFAGTFLLRQQPAPEFSAGLLLEYGFESPQPQLVVRSVTRELVTTSAPIQYQKDYLNMMAAIKALDSRYASVLEELDQKDVSEFTERKALSYYRKKVNLMTELIRELTIAKNNEEHYAKNKMDHKPSI